MGYTPGGHSPPFGARVALNSCDGDFIPLDRPNVWSAEWPHGENDRTTL